MNKIVKDCIKLTLDWEKIWVSDRKCYEAMISHETFINDCNIQGQWLTKLSQEPVV